LPPPSGYPRRVSSAQNRIGWLGERSANPSN
jgi:hypothetical protein